MAKTIVLDSTIRLPKFGESFVISEKAIKELVNKPTEEKKDDNKDIR